ncbi:MAG: hypothetical protein WA324_06015 [Bryobacteraceae bacterium]
MDRNPLHDKTNYQGAKLARLLAALAIPTFLYYARLALAVAASRAGIGTPAFLWLMRSSTAVLVLFFGAEIVAALYLRRLFRAPKSTLGRVVQVGAIAAVCGALSIGAAVLLESFAYEMLIRTTLHP